MKKVMTLAAGLLLTTSVFASTVNVDSTKQIDAGTYQTKAEAYDAGFDLSDSLQTMNKHQLSNELSLWAYNSVNHLAIDDTKVVIEEFASAEGDIQYRAILDVDYHFRAHESD